MKMMPRSERNKRLRRLLIPALFCLLSTIVFATQFAGTGIGEGHYGWVSSNTLSIMSRATVANGFVGHARNLLDANGTLDYNYFDRTPVFFSAIVGALIRLANDLPTKVWIARQAMLFLFVLSMLFAWLLLRRLGLKSMAALAAVTLGFSGYQLLYYRELVDFSQPALFGMLLLLYVIARVKLERRTRWRWLTVATLVAVSLGRVPVSLSVLGLWAAFEAAGLLWQCERPLRQRLRAILAHDATRMLLLGVIWILLMTGYNIAHEMARRAVPLEQTSLVDSMQRRLPGADNALAPSDFVGYAPLVAERLNRWFLPVNEAVTWGVPHWVSLLVIMFVLVFSLRQRPVLRVPLLLTAFSGLAWIFGMINVTRYHEFMTMHVLGLALVFWLAVLRLLQRTPIYVFVMLLFGLTLFLRSSLRVEADHAPYFQGVAIYTEEYDRILQQIGSSGQVIYSEHAIQDKVINAAKYRSGAFILADNVLCAGARRMPGLYRRQSWRVSEPSRPGYAPLTTVNQICTLNIHHTLTPENRVAFLFDMLPDSEVRMLPEALEPQPQFRKRASRSGQWELARQCSGSTMPAHLGLDSWWQRRPVKRCRPITACPTGSWLLKMAAL